MEKRPSVLPAEAVVFFFFFFFLPQTPMKSIQTAPYWAGFGQNVKKRAIKTGLHRSDCMENAKENRHTSSSGVETLPPSTQYSVTIANSLPSVSIKGTRNKQVLKKVPKIHRA
jgi:hypothetical protein